MKIKIRKKKSDKVEFPSIEQSKRVYFVEPINVDPAVKNNDKFKRKNRKITQELLGNSQHALLA